ncbi:MAG: hypothetical protein AAF664_12710 [Planctomycetota bacterium]
MSTIRAQDAFGLGQSQVSRPIPRTGDLIRRSISTAPRPSASLRWRSVADQKTQHQKSQLHSPAPQKVTPKPRPLAANMSEAKPLPAQPVVPQRQPLVQTQPTITVSSVPEPVRTSVVESQVQPIPAVSPQSIAQPKKSPSASSRIAVAQPSRSPVTQVAMLREFLQDDGFQIPGDLLPAPSSQPNPTLDDLPAGQPQTSELLDFLETESPKVDGPMPDSPSDQADAPEIMKEMPAGDQESLNESSPFGSDPIVDSSDLRERPRRAYENSDAMSPLARQAKDPGSNANAGGISCEDFRRRITESTIDQISLDISPPYRPDEIDVARYEKLKAKFDAAQEDRQWRNVDGTPLARGRLQDLAYENAVIETEFGTTKQLPINQLSEADLAYISDNWGLPQTCLLEQVAYQPRAWQCMAMTWKASNLCHKPLYFEDVNLERYGHTRGPILEPLYQSAHFFANIAVLPYKMGVHSPCECQYALGYYRPGSCAPWIKPAIPISAKGAINQALSISGYFWYIP